MKNVRYTMFLWGHGATDARENWHNLFGNLFDSIYMNLCITYDTTISLLGIYPTELCANVQQNTFVRVFTETQALFIVDKNFPNHTKK